MASVNKIISALNSETRREIIKIICEQPRTVNEVFKEINKNMKFTVKYRESVYRSLEKLVDAGLVEKYYDKDKGICYKLLIKRIELDLVNGTAKVHR